MTKRYLHAGLGGTFDHLHRGHEAIIDKAFEISDKVSIGVSNDTMLLNKEFDRSLETYQERLDGLKKYLHKKNYLSPSQIFELKDIYGTSVSDAKMDCLVVSKDTLSNAKLINNKRHDLGLKPIDIIEVVLIEGADGKIISSTRIRKGSIDRQGDKYLDLFSSDVIKLPTELRQKLRNPLATPILGKTLQETADLVKKSLSEKKPLLTIAVGDIVSETLTDIGVMPDISIIDFKSRRKELSHAKKITKYTKYQNDPGTINFEVVSKINNAINDALSSQKKSTIVIAGEEDLLALPAILLAPLKSVVVYGQMDMGVILVEVTEKIKEKVGKIVKQFVS